MKVYMYCTTVNTQYLLDTYLTITCTVVYSVITNICREMQKLHPLIANFYDFSSIFCSVANCKDQKSRKLWLPFHLSMSREYKDDPLNMNEKNVLRIKSRTYKEYHRYEYYVQVHFGKKNQHLVKYICILNIQMVLLYRYVYGL